MIKNSKSILFALFISIMVSSCYTARVNVSVDPISSILQVEKSKDELYIIANNWMVNNFVNAEMVIQFSDKEAGILIGKYIFQPTYAYNGYSRYQTEGVKAILKIQVKDNSAKITIDPALYNNPQSSLNQAGVLTKEEAIQKVEKTINSFESYVKNYSSDW